jgi:hypothetical protein
MIAIPKTKKTVTTKKTTKAARSAEAEADAKYLEFEPNIHRTALFAFSGYDADRLDDAIQSVKFHVFIMLRSMASRGILNQAYPGQITWFAIHRHRSGRIGGVPSSSTDVLAERCRIRQRSKVTPLASTMHTGFEVMPSDARYPLDRAVAFRLDFVEWFRRQLPRDQKIIRDLALGYTPQEVSRKYGFRKEDVNDLRQKLYTSWEKYINPGYINPYRKTQ